MSTEPNRLFIPALAPVYRSGHDLAETLLRLVAGGFLVIHGAGKIVDPFGAAQMVEGLGFYPGVFWSPLLAATEFFGGILLAGLAIFCIIFPLIEGRGFGWPAWCFVMLALAIPFGIAFALSAAFVFLPMGVERLTGRLERERRSLGVGKAIHGGIVEDDVGSGAAGEGGGGRIDDFGDRNFGDRITDRDSRELQAF